MSQIRKQFRAQVKKVHDNACQKLPGPVVEALFRPPGWSPEVGLFLRANSSTSLEFVGEGANAEIFLENPQEVDPTGITDKDDKSVFTGATRVAVKSLKEGCSIKDLVYEAAFLHAGYGLLDQFLPKLFGFFVELEENSEVVESLDIIMEVVEGKTLDSWLRTSPEPHHILFFFECLAVALLWKSFYRLEHGDLHTENIIVKVVTEKSRGGHDISHFFPVLIDFGYARISDASQWDPGNDCKMFRRIFDALDCNDSHDTHYLSVVRSTKEIMRGTSTDNGETFFVAVLRALQPPLDVLLLPGQIDLLVPPITSNSGQTNWFLHDLLRMVLDSNKAGEAYGRGLQRDLWRAGQDAGSECVLNDVFAWWRQPSAAIPFYDGKNLDMIPRTSPRCPESQIGPRYALGLECFHKESYVGKWFEGKGSGLPKRKWKVKENDKCPCGSGHKAKFCVQRLTRQLQQGVLPGMFVC